MKKMIEKTEEKAKKNTNLEINVLPLLMYLLKKIWIILLVGAVVGAMGYTVTKLFVHPTYKCSFTAYVNNKQAATSTDFLTSSDVSAAKQLVLTYSQIFKSNTILASADEAMDLNYEVKQLKQMVGTEIQDETEIIQVYAVAKSPDEAYKIATAIASVSPEIMADIVEGSSMKIVEYPQLPDSIYKPSYSKFTLLSFAGGFLLAAGILVVLYLRNDTVTDEEEVESRFAVPVLGVIPDVNHTGNRKSGYYYNYYYEKEDKGDHDTEKA